MIAVLAAAGLGAWSYGHLPPISDTPTLHVERADAIEYAKQTLQKRYSDTPLSHLIHDVTDRWYVIATVDTGDCDKDRGAFVWETQDGREGFERVMNDGYLEPPHWRVKFLQFDIHENDTAKRAERFSVAIKQGALTSHDEEATLQRTLSLHRVVHRLPESSKGLNLTKEEAERIAYSYACTLPEVAAHEVPSTDALTLISSSSEKQPNRMDWRFTYADRRLNYILKGEARLEVDVSGDEVTYHRFYLHIPEEWRREQQKNQAMLDLVREVSGGILLLVFFGAFLMALARWSMRGELVMSIFKSMFFLLIVSYVVSGINNYTSVVESNLDTSEPLYHQIIVRLGRYFLRSTLQSFMFALVLAFLHYRQVESQSSELHVGSTLGKTVLGIAVGIAWSGLAYGARKMLLKLMDMNDSTPSCPSFKALSAFNPALSVALEGTRSFLMSSLLFLAITAAADALCRSTSASRRFSLKNITGLIILFIISGMILEGASLEEGSSNLMRDWAIPSMTFGLSFVLLYVLVLARDYTLVPTVAAALCMLDASQDALWTAFPGAQLGFLLLVALISVIALLWTASLQTESLSRTVGRASSSRPSSAVGSKED